MRGRPQPPILFLIRALRVGGAERQLSTLAGGLAARGHEVHVAIFYSGGALESDLRDFGVVVHSLEKRSRWEVLRPLLRLRRLCHLLRPSYVVAYLGLANIFSALLKMSMPSVRIVWSVRASNMDLAQYERAFRLSYAIERRLARVPDLIIANSNAGRDYAIQQGFPESRIRVIPNGIDTGRFYPDSARRTAARRRWGVAEDDRVVGIVARLDPMKDFETFFRAAAIVSSRHPNARFVAVVTGGVPDYAERMRGLARMLLSSDVFQWVDGDIDAAVTYNGLDLLCSSSITEGFSNVVGEAMACGVPAVVTDVGDSAWIVADTGAVAPPRDPEALAAAIERLLGTVRGELGQRARRRVEEHFSVDRLVNRVERLLSTSTGGEGCAGSADPDDSIAARPAEREQA